MNSIATSYEAEQSVIGIIAIDAGNKMPLIVSELSEDDFLVPEFKTLYKKALSLFRDKKDIDTVTLLSGFGDEYKAVIWNAAQSVPSTRNYKAYVEMVKCNSQRVTAKVKALDLIDRLDRGSDIPDCQEAAAEIIKCFDISKSDDTVSAQQGYLDFCRRQGTPRKYIKTGLAKLDRYTYIDRGDYIIVGARPSAGKTALTLQIMSHIAREHKTAYFSLETSATKIFERLIASNMTISLRNIKNNEITDRQWLDIAESGEQFSRLNFGVVQASGWTVEQIKAKSMQLGAEVIFVDYIGLIKGEGKSQYEKMTNISNDLHTMAQKYGITVFALSQLSREGKGTPDMSSLRDSGAIEQDADCILLLGYDDKTPDRRQLLVAKNKDGGIGKIDLNFRGEVQRFSEIDTRYGKGDAS